MTPDQTTAQAIASAPDPGAALREVIAAEVAAAVGVHRDLVSRLGFGDNITEPMADNDTIVKWYEERSNEASEWVESQLWRGDCYLAGHPDTEDCWEHDPSLRLEAAERECDRLTRILARCPLDIKGHSCCDCTHPTTHIPHDNCTEAQTCFEWGFGAGWKSAMDAYDYPHTRTTYADHVTDWQEVRDLARGGAE